MINQELQTAPIELTHDAPETIDSLDGIKAHLKDRGPLFINRMAAISQDVPLGKEVIERNGNLISHKERGRQPGFLFTGKDLCTFAAYALRDGLRHRTQGIDLDVVRLETDIHAENWDDEEYIPSADSMRLHDILRATSQETGKSLFFDPTYAQIDHRQSGKLLCIEEEELGRFYSHPETLERVSREDFDFNDEVNEALNLTPESFRILISALN